MMMMIEDLRIWGFEDEDEGDYEVEVDVDDVNDVDDVDDVVHVDDVDDIQNPVDDEVGAGLNDAKLCRWCGWWWSKRW